MWCVVHALFWAALPSRASIGSVSPGCSCWLELEPSLPWSQPQTNLNLNMNFIIFLPVRLLILESMFIT